jgi:hypothetical protein|tara:strand:- start:1434 stop:1829 length:396 start_codon:yes stop_codon:yes gene_type:complete
MGHRQHQFIGQSEAVCQGAGDDGLDATIAPPCLDGAGETREQRPAMYVSFIALGVDKIGGMEPLVVQRPAITRQHVQGPVEMVGTDDEISVTHCPKPQFGIHIRHQCSALHHRGRHPMFGEQNQRLAETAQ